MTVMQTDHTTTESLSRTLDSMVEFHKRFVVHSDDSTHDLAVLWAAHTYGMTLWKNTPRLYVTAPEPQCGKSTQAALLAFFVPNAEYAAHTTAAGFFHAMDSEQPVFFLDETDKTFNNSWGRDNVLTGAINAGYERDGSIRRADKKYRVYGAMMLSGIDNGCIPDDTQTRSIPVLMSVGRPTDYFDKYDHNGYQEHVHTALSAHAQFWTRDVTVPEWLSNRQRELWLPLFAVAQAAGEDWYARCERAAERHQWVKPVSAQRATLVAVREWFAEHADDRVQPAVLTAWVAEYPYANVSSGKGLHNVLRGYGVESRRDRRGRFYHRADLETAWGKWL